MKKLITILSFSVTTAFAQTGYNHFQSFDLYSWSKKTDSTIILSVGKYSEQYITEFNLNTQTTKHLNDSIDQRFYLAEMNGDTGVGVSNVSDLYYTHDNWKNVTKITGPVTGIKGVIHTNTGFLGYFNTSSSFANYYHSTNGSNWTLVTAQSTNPGYKVMAYKDGKTWLLGRPDKFQVSYDGGQTFVQKNPVGVPAVTFTEFIPLDTSNGIGLAANWYRTHDGGNSWTQMLVPAGSYLVYVEKIDSIYIYNSTNGVQLSTDSGQTWTNTSLSLPENTNARFYKVGKTLLANPYTGMTNSALYSSNGLNTPWTLVHKRSSLEDFFDVSFKGNFGIIGGFKGEYAYSQNGGKTFQKWTIKLGTEDLMACEVVNDTLMLIADRKSNIWISKDGGVSWSKNYSNSFNYFGRKFVYSNDLSKILLFRAGQTLISQNGGNSWSILVTAGGTYDGDITPNGKILYAINNGSNLTVEEVSTGGTRTVIKTFTEQNLTAYGLEMISDNIGYYFALDQTNNEVHAFKTTDGWNTYSFKGKFANPITLVGQGLYFNIPATDTIYVNLKNTSNSSNSSNAIYQSFDGGTTWTSTIIVTAKQGGTTDKLQSMHFFDGKSFISVWQDGRIYLNKELKGDSTPSAINENNFDALNSIIAYPNPFTNYFNLQSPQLIEDVKVIDLSGKIISSDAPFSLTHKIDLTHQPKGIYLVSIISNNNRQILKVVKQ